MLVVDDENPSSKESAKMRGVRPSRAREETTNRRREKKDENRVACTLARAVSRNAVARVRRDPSRFSVFPGGVVVKDEREDKFCIGIYLLRLVSYNVASGHKRGGGKTRQILYLETNRRQRLTKPPFFCNQNEQQTVIATTALVAASVVSPEASHAAQNVIAQVAEGEPFLVDVAWGAILSSFSFSLALVVWGRSGL